MLIFTEAASTKPILLTAAFVDYSTWTNSHPLNKLAELANLDRTYISQIERGLKSPSIKALITLAKALNIRAHVLVQEMEKELDNSPIREKRDQTGENRTKRTID